MQPVPCGGDDCSVAPPSTCVDDITLRVATVPGVCDVSTQDCLYTYTDQFCEMGCVNNACRPVGRMLYMDFGETWLLDGATWTQVTTAHAPPGFSMSWNNMTFDAGRQRVVLVGDGNSTNDTWEFEGVDWTVHPTVHSPPGVHLPTVAYFPPTGHVVWTSSSGIYLYDGVDWLQSFGATSLDSPSVYDSVARQLVLGYGRYRYDGNVLSTIEGGALNVTHPAMTYDPLGQRILAFGGYDGNQDIDKMWEFHNNAWMELSPATKPGPRRGTAMVYYSPHQAIYLFGGTGGDASLWRFANNNWAIVPTNSGPFGSGYNGMVVTTF